ncbi:hypothetical protein ACIOD1_33390 [Streptomyces sp. NPDC088097]|uniref:hypothetical protein n=1 Tax=Streptomyces sp. NPDC088097 TaxID=3365823 RepID=UPI00381B976C
MLAIGIGTTLGLLVRRTVAAMAATAVTGVVVLFALEHVRGALWPTVVAQRSDITAEPAPDGAWILNGGLLDTTGRRVPESSECYASTDYGQCLAGKGITGRWTEFHPASHFWPLQWTQTGLCLAASAALIALCFWWTRHRLT